MAGTLPTPSVIIYGLAASKCVEAIRYVGKTRGSLAVRINQHIREVNRRNTPKNAWIKSLLKQGEKLVGVVLETCSEYCWEERERYWISKLRLSGLLTNATDGGDTGPDMTGYKHSDETRAKLCVIQRSIKRVWTEEQKQRLRQINTGRKMPLSAVLKMREKKLLQIASGSRSWERGIMAAIAKNRGRPCSSETREKIRQSQIGRTQSMSTILSIMKPIKCRETGSWFASFKEASSRSGVGRTNIGNALKGGTKAGGFHWEYAERR